MIEIQAYIHNIPIKRNFIEELPFNKKLKDRAKKLRKAGNFPEVVFWKQVRAASFWKIDFDRQRIIGNYIVDFYIKTFGLIVEAQVIMIKMFMMKNENYIYVHWI